MNKTAQQLAEEIAQYVIDNRHSRGEGQTMPDIELYTEVKDRIIKGYEAANEQSRFDPNNPLIDNAAIFLEENEISGDAELPILSGKGVIMAHDIMGDFAKKCINEKTANEWVGYSWLVGH